MFRLLMYSCLLFDYDCEDRTKGSRAFLKTLQRIGLSLHGMCQNRKNTMKREIFWVGNLHKKVKFKVFMDDFYFDGLVPK